MKQRPGAAGGTWCPARVWHSLSKVCVTESVSVLNLWRQTVWVWILALSPGDGVMVICSRCPIHPDLYQSDYHMRWRTRPKMRRLSLCLSVSLGWEHVTTHLCFSAQDANSSTNSPIPVPEPAWYFQKLMSCDYRLPKGSGSADKTIHSYCILDEARLIE